MRLVAESAEKLQFLKTEFRRVYERRKSRKSAEKNGCHGSKKGSFYTPGRSLDEREDHGGSEFFHVFEKLFQ